MQTTARVKDGRTALFVAVQYGKTDVVDALLALKCDINFRTVWYTLGRATPYWLTRCAAHRPQRAARRRVRAVPSRALHHSAASCTSRGSQIGRCGAAQRALEFSLVCH